ncbi:MAG TPA: MMPL family transporter [Bacteroidales bacterium]|nr:MMPL family transporter [Bacteroidales bacterium]
MEKIIKYRWFIIIISILITGVLALNLQNIETDPDLKNYFPDHMESMIATDSIEKYFGNQDMVIILFKTNDIINKESLLRIRDVERQVKRLRSVRSTNSLFSSSRIYGKQGVMYVDPAITALPETIQERDSLRNIIEENDLVMNIVVADDYRSSAIIASLKDDTNEDTLFLDLNRIIEDIPGKEKVYFGGLPYIRTTMKKEIAKDGYILAPFALIFMIIFLFFVFREKKGVLLPFLVVLLSSLFAISLIPLLGWKFYFITVLVPIMLIAIANDYGIHMIAKYQEINASEDNIDMKALSVRIAKKLRKPIFLTGATTIAGIAALLAHTMIPARQMALISAIGIIAALYFSIILLPALLSLQKRSAPVLKRKNENVKTNSLLNKLANSIIRHYKIIPVSAIVIALIISAGAVFLKVDSNEENFFPKKHPVKQAANLLNAKYGGSENLSILFEGDALDPAMLKRMIDYEKKLLKEDEIDLVMSFADIIKEISKALYDPGDPMYDAIPDSRFAVAQFMELYNMNGSASEIDQLVDFNYEHAHMIIRINEASNRVVNKLIDVIREMTENDPDVATIGGYGLVRSQLATEVVHGQFWSLGIAIAVVFLLLSIIFRSATAGLISIIPLVISISILFGVMGYTGIRLDIVTALLSSVMIGVGIDYTIHLLWRYREERKKPGRTKKEDIYTTLTTTGRGIIFNALSVIIGFVVLLASSFPPLRYFGVLVVLSIISCLIGAMVILPALILKFDFKFLEYSQNTEVETGNKETELKNKPDAKKAG